MNSDSKKHDYFAKVLSNHIYAVLMGTVHGRCTTTEKSKYCFANMGSFSSYDLTGPSGECGCLLSLPSLSWFLLVSGSGFSFSSHKMTFFFFSSSALGIDHASPAPVCTSSLELCYYWVKGCRPADSLGLRQKDNSSWQVLLLSKDLMTGPSAPAIYLSTSPRAHINSCAHAACMTVI